MDDNIIVTKYILQQVRDKKIEKNMALKILKQLADKPYNKSNDIAIIGMSCRFPKAKNKEEYWDNIVNRRCNITGVPLERKKYLNQILNEEDEDIYFKAGFLDEIDKFDPSFFRISPKEAKLMNPKQRLLLEVIYNAIEDSGYAGKAIYGSDTGIYVGNDHSVDLKAHYGSLIEDEDFLVTTGNLPGLLASRVSYILNLKGPSLVIDSACSSGLVAVHMACEALKNKECKMAITGGVNLFLLPTKIQDMREIESKTGEINVFDKNSKGTAWGEGVSSIVLKPLNKAIEDRDNIYAVIKGSAINNDGASNGITAPSAEAQENLLVRAWKRAKINPESIQYIETHGTGTKLGDSIEIKGITNAFRRYTDKKQFCGIGSAKPNIGHTNAVSGMASLIKVVLALKNGVIPPNIGFHEPNPFIDFSNSPIYFNDIVSKWKKGSTPVITGVSSFGFSGTNAHIVLQEVSEINYNLEEKHGPEILTISAKSKNSLVELVKKYIDFANKEENYSLSDFCYTANTGRRQCNYKKFIVIKDKTDFKQKLKELYKSLLNVEDINKISNISNEGSIKLANEKIEEFVAGGKEDIIILYQIGEFYENGIDIKWNYIYIGEKRRRISIPTYPFLRERYWANIRMQPRVHLVAHKGDSIDIKLIGKKDDKYSKLEVIVGQVWGNALGFNQIDIESNFYEIGGDSIIAIRIANVINKELEMNIKISDLFNNPTIKKLADFIDNDSKKTGYSIIPRAEKAKYYSLSSSQKRIFILKQINKNDISYNIPLFLIIDGILDELRFENAFRKVIERHETLRTSFDIVNGEPVQKIEENVKFKINKFNCNNDELDDLIDKFIKPFDLKEVPLIRASLARINDSNKHFLMVDMHHIIADGASVEVFEKELISFYENIDMPEIRIQFKDFAIWQNQLFISEDMKKQEKYWEDRFKGELPILNLPLDFPRTSFKNYDGERIEFYLGRELALKFNKLNEKLQVTPFMTLMTAFNILLLKYTHQEDIVIGSPISGRSNKELENMIGMFVNTLAFRNYPTEEKVIKDFLLEVKDSTLKAYENQDYPFERLIDKLKIDRNLNVNALFNAMIVLQSIENTEIKVNGVKYIPYTYKNNTSKFDMVLYGYPKENDMKFELNYCSKLFKRSTAKRLVKHFLNILEFMVSNEDNLISDIKLLSKSEKKKIIEFGNNISVDCTNEKTICEIFETQVEKMPNNFAVTGVNGSLTYRKLNEKANQLASLLIKNNVSRNEIIGIMVERTEKFIISILGVLKAGAAYLPIDSIYPKERIKYMLDDSNVRILLTDNVNKNKFQSEVKEICIEDEEIYFGKSHNLRKLSMPEDLVYVIYTSGSTGKPKGVMIKQSSVINFVQAFEEKIYSMYTGSLNLALLAPFVFDASCKQIFPSLLLGHRLYIIPNYIRTNAIELIRFYKENEIDISDGTPSYITILSDTCFYNRIHVKHFIIGGETLLLEEVKKFYDNFGENKPYITNTYGPTECCIDATAYTIKPEETYSLKDITIGKPLKNYNIYILDKKHRLVPEGVVGEICISGEGVAKGYINNEKLTRERFVKDIIDSKRKMYKTGDLGRWTEDGNIQFIGRKDNQVKIRGYRIELDEIKNRILSYKGIKDAVVLCRKNHLNIQYISAYITCSEEIEPINLKDYLMEHLPNYMVPQNIIPVQKINLNNNGKVDTSFLPNTEEELKIEEKYIAPQNEIQEILCNIWAEIIGVDKVGIKDNFFVLGGDSIKAIQLIAKMDKYRLSLQLKDIFKYQTIGELSSKIKVNTKEIDNSLVLGGMPFSPIQFWMLQRNTRTLGYRNLAFVLYRKEGFGKKNTERIFTEIVKHHDALRIILKRQSDKIYQYNRGIDGKLFDIKVVDLENSQDFVKDAENVIDSIHASIDLENGPLVKLGLIKGNAGEHLLIVIHQMVIDHMSWRIIFEDFITAFTQLSNKQQIVLPNKTDSFKKWVEYIYKYAKSSQLLSEKSYWDEVENTELVELPVDNKIGAPFIRDNFIVQRKLNYEDTERLINLVKNKKDVKIEAIFLYALGVTIKQWTGSNDLIVNLGSHGRDLILEGVNISRTVGRFAAMYPAAFKLPETENYKLCLEYFNKSLKNIPNDGIGYGILRYISSLDKKLRINLKLNPEISFSHMGNFDTDLNTDVFKISTLPSGKNISGEEVFSYKLKIFTMIITNRLNINIEYNKNQFKEDTINVFFDNYIKNLNKITEHIPYI
ncbi:non-ribosomal peptide synthetase [Clostridium akagii]|uniref:non-ribosomal peptide synthetase n=1 Tax=Clostridium akagii TaxID=91623 RepID=UPI00068B3CDE|nr:non-ribosomal peptide synthetase [Clostridium akagii]